MKKANAPIKFDSDDTEGSDLSYESSFDEKEDNQGSTKEQKNINLFKEQMVRYLLTHPELQDDIKFNKDLEGAEWADAPKSHQKADIVQAGTTNIGFGNNTLHGQKQPIKPINDFKTQKNEPQKKKDYRNPMWESIASNLMQESKRTGAMPSIEMFSQRLNLFRQKIEKPDVIDMILNNKDQLLKQIKKEEERKAKIQNRIHETIEAKLRKEQGDVKYYSKLKKNQFDSRMEKEEKRVRQNKQTTTSTPNLNQNQNNLNANNPNGQNNMNNPNNANGNYIQNNQNSSGNVNQSQLQNDKIKDMQMQQIQNFGLLNPRPNTAQQKDNSVLVQQGKQLKTQKTTIIPHSSILIPTQNYINMNNNAANNNNNIIGQNQLNLFNQNTSITGNSNTITNANNQMQVQAVNQPNNITAATPKGKSLRFSTPEQNIIPKSQIRQDLENRIMNSNNPILKDNVKLISKAQIENSKQSKAFKARPIPGVYERLSQDNLKKNQTAEIEIDQPLDIEFKTLKGEQLYREISKKEDEEEIKRYVIKFLLEHRQKAEDEFKAKPSLLSQGQKYYSEESKEFSLLSPNFLAKKKMAELIEKGMITDDFFEHRANLEEGNVYLLTKVSKILRGNLIKKWKNIQDSKF